MLKRLRSLLAPPAPTLTPEEQRLLFGAKVMQARRQVGVSQAEAAKELGIRAAKLSKIENGEEETLPAQQDEILHKIRFRLSA
jgi:ribosome-binding protein aMBF1 (putative translation factor)